MDDLDFASRLEGPAGKIGIDATTKIGTRTARDWGREIAMLPAAEAFADRLVAGPGGAG